MRPGHDYPEEVFDSLEACILTSLGAHKRHNFATYTHSSGIDVAVVSHDIDENWVSRRPLT